MDDRKFAEITKSMSREMTRRGALARLAGGLVAAAGASRLGVRPTTAASVDPDFVAGNPSCTSLGYDFGCKLDQGTSGDATCENGAFTATVTSDGAVFSWESNIGVDAVIAKGGPNANVYVYDPPVESFGDDELSAPDNGGQPFGLSHVEFCYDYELTVSKTAETSLTRTWDWDIKKTCPAGTVTCNLNETCTVPGYQVDVSTTGSTDSDWAVEGTITIENETPFAATITAVNDVISPNIAATVDCGATFPHVLAVGGTLECTYSASLPDGTDRTNTAAVTTTGQVDGGEAEADVDFANATVTDEDDCVDVTDDQFGILGTVCLEDLPKTFEYDQQIGPFEVCGPTTFPNEASFVTNDTGATGESGCSIDIDVPCPTTTTAPPTTTTAPPTTTTAPPTTTTAPPGFEGCTPGFWKNHTSAWVGYTPGQTLESVFDLPDSLGLDNKTLLEALNFGGGSGVKGAAQNLLRAAVAALLNAAHPDINYPMTAAEVIAQVNAALASNNRATMLGLATTLDTQNNAGCPIDGNENVAPTGGSTNDQQGKKDKKKKGKKKGGKKGKKGKKAASKEGKKNKKKRKSNGRGRGNGRDRR